VEEEEAAAQREDNKIYYKAFVDQRGDFVYGKCLAVHTNCNFPMVNLIQAVEKWLLPESSI
jgi:hypothetical protein